MASVLETTSPVRSGVVLTESVPNVPAADGAGKYGRVLASVPSGSFEEAWAKSNECVSLRREFWLARAGLSHTPSRALGP